MSINAFLFFIGSLNEQKSNNCNYFPLVFIVFARKQIRNNNLFLNRCVSKVIDIKYKVYYMKVIVITRRKRKIYKVFLLK